MTYDKDRPYIPADIRRQIETEAGHACAVKHCTEHIAEIHHIDDNRENNDPANLILLCDKHHKLAHRKEISRKDLREYKRLLHEPAVISPTFAYSDHDKKLLRTLNAKFNMNYLNNLKDDPFWKLVKRSVVDTICDYIDYESEDPLNAFDDQELESLRNQIIKVGREFNSEFSMHCGGSVPAQHYEYISNSYFNGVPKDQCDDLERSRERVLKHATDLHQALLHLRNFERLI